MFFNKKDKEMQKDNITEEDFVVSEYARERYKKRNSSKADKVNLTNKEIEILFGDKNNCNIEIENTFLKVLKKLRDFSYVVFPKYNYNFEGRKDFENCIFNGGSLSGEIFYFKNCTFYKNEYSFNIHAKKTIQFKKIDSASSINIESCKSLQIADSHIHSLCIEKNNLNKIDIHIHGTMLDEFMNLDSDIDKLKMSDVKFKDNFRFNFDSVNINFLMIKNINLNNVDTVLSYISPDLIIEDLTIIESQFPFLFDLNTVKNNCTISESKISNLEGFINSDLDLDISNSELIYKKNYYRIYIEVKSLAISTSKVDKLIILDTKTVLLRESVFQNLALREDIEDIYIAETTVEEQCNLSSIRTKNICVLQNNTFKNSIDFKFSSIHKLAIYQSSFKALDFDCSFIDEARFVGVKGIDNDEVVDLTDKHFASKESFEYFKGVLSQ